MFDKAYILANYPGHILAALLLIVGFALIVTAYRGAAARRAGYWRMLLGALQYAAIAGLLVVIWNPSVPDYRDSTDKNRVLVFFDTSESMSVADNGSTSRLDRALNLFEEHVRQVGPEAPEYQIFGFDLPCYGAPAPDALHRWGKTTELGPVVDQIAKATRAERDGRAGVTGAVIFTDGQPNVKNAAIYPPLPDGSPEIVVVGMGSDELGADVCVAGLTAPAQAVVDSAYSVQTTLAGNHLAGHRVTLEVLDNDTLIYSETLEGDAVEASIVKTIPLAAADLGAHTITVRTSLDSNEMNQANNLRHVQVDVVEEKPIRVLLYTQVASFDIGKIRQALSRDKKVSLDLGFDVLQNAALRQNDARYTHAAQQPKADGGLIAGSVKLPMEPTEFNQYDVIILGPLEKGTTTAAWTQNLYNFVAQRGGGVVFLAGPNPWDIRETPPQALQALLPVDSISGNQGTTSASSTPHLTLDGAQILPIDPKDIQRLAPRTAPFYGEIHKKPAASILLESGNTPLVVVHRVGRGHVAYLNVRHLYRWYRADLEGGLLRSLFSGLTAYVGSVPKQEAGLDLMAARLPDDPQRLRFDAFVYDDAFQPVTGATVLLETGSQTYRMDESREGRYELLLDGAGVESVLAQAEAQKDGDFLGSATLATQLPLPRREMDEVERDATFMQAFAEHYQGTYLGAEDLEKDALPPFEGVTKQSQLLDLIPVWRTWPVLLGLCGLLTALWFIRRTIGLA